MIQLITCSCTFLDCAMRDSFLPSAATKLKSSAVSKAPPPGMLAHPLTILDLEGGRLPANTLKSF